VVNIVLGNRNIINERSEIMELNIKTFKIKIKKEEKEVIMITGGFSSHTDYRIVEEKIMRRPTSYEYQKIYKKLRKED